MTLAMILAALPTLVETADDLLAVLQKLRDIAALRGLDAENAALDAALADAAARKQREIDRQA